MDVVYKIPQESPDYRECSQFAVEHIGTIMRDAIKEGRNRIFIRTNLKRGLPLENINKVAGPFVEAWAVEQFELISEDAANPYRLINVQAGKKLEAFDVILQFRRTNGSYASANVDVKATAEDIVKAGKNPNITSFARIRTEYLDDPDYLFIILSLKHRVYSEKGAEDGMTNGIMEVRAYNVYDLKHVGAADICYNRALGTGQIQIRDIQYVTIEPRTTWEFLQLLDAKCIRSKGEEAWLLLARKYKWIKEVA